jgi:glycosyltransferase involved in cell wall biosynthesis
LKVSIVTISFNQRLYLQEAIQSILSQDYGNTEYIVVDPGSTDGSRDLILSHSSSIDRVVFRPDIGPANGLNNGFASATGEIFCYINADDRLLPGALRRAVGYFLAHPDVDVLCGNGYEIDRFGQRVRKIFSSDWSPEAYGYGAANVVQQATFIRSTAFKMAGGFNDENVTCWDGELLVDLALTGARFMRVDDFLGEFRLYPTSITGSGRLDEVLQKDRLRINDKIFGSRKRRGRWVAPAVYRLRKYVAHPSHTFYKALHLLRGVAKGLFR